MPKAKKTFKFYLNTGRLLGFSRQPELPLPKKKRRLLAFLWEVVFGVCFKFGNWLYQSALLLAKKAKKELRETAHNFPRRLALIKRAEFAKTLAIFLVAATVTWGAFSAFGLLARGLELKNQLLGLGTQGAQDLQDAKTALQNKDFTQAQNKFQLAYNSFTQGPQKLEQENAALSQLLNLFPQKQDADKLFSAASLLSSAGDDITVAYQQINDWKISQAGLTSGGKAGVNIGDSLKTVQTALNKINQAGSLLNSVNPASLPDAYRAKLQAVQDNYTAIHKAFGSFSEMLSLGSGYLDGDKHLLILMENNNELRPTGGFIGTFGDAQIHNGSIKSLNISSIYDLDGQLTQRIRPPFPMFAVNDRWYLRDSNWFADFPATAQKISDFYEKEGGQTPDEIIVLTPTVVQNILGLTGPIDLPHYGVTLTKDNFVEETQVEASVDYSRVDNKPKQILADLFPVLLSRLGSLPKEQFPQFLQIIQDSFSQKQAVLYSRDRDTQNLIESLNWGGQVLDTDRDYLSMVSANLNGSKTDLFVKQTISLKTVLSKDGSIIDNLTITRTNTMPDLPDTANSSFIRIFVPQNSTLLTNLGFDYNTSTPPSLNGYQIDPDVEAWEKTISRDLISGTSIGQESGKTFFANWLTVKGGETKTVTLSYKLPFKLGDIDHFSLLAQKQIGALPADFSYELDFPSRHLLWQNITPADLQIDSLNYNFPLDGDTLVGEVFQKY